MREWAKLANRLLSLIEWAVAEYKRREKQKAIDKIKSDPGVAWDDTFGVRDTSDQ